MCSQFLLIALRTEYSPLVYSARDCFQDVLYEKYNIFRYNLYHNYDKVHSRMYQIAAFKYNFSG